MYVAPNANRPGLKALRTQGQIRQRQALLEAQHKRNAEALAKVAGK